MTREEAILLSAYTGFLLAPDFSEVHKFCEDTLGRPIWTHEFADNDVQKEIQEKLRPQIMELVQNIAALRPLSREMVEKVWTGCEKCRDQANWPSWIEKGVVYCPKCGTPLTSWAWKKQMERVEAITNATD